MTYAGSGMLGDGLFGMYLKAILLSGNVSDEYKGEEEIGERRLARFDYRLRLMWSGQTIQMPEGSGRVGLHGSYWVDAQTYDAVRLQLDAEDIPPTLPITEFVTSINYARTAVGNNLMVLLPESAETRMAKFNGEINHDRVEFTHCRVFGAETTVDYNAADSAEQEPRFAAASVDDTLRPLPAGLRIAVKLRTPISADIAVGALIDGLVADNVSAKGTVLIPVGAPVRGRIRRMERYTDPIPHFVVALEFTELAIQQIRYRFYADLVDIEAAPGVEHVLSVEQSGVTNSQLGGAITKQSNENLFLFDLSGVATFFFRGSKLDLPQGFRTVWKTRRWQP